MHRALFALPDAGGLGSQAIRKLALGEGLDMAVFDECIENPSGRIARDTHAAGALGIASTPTFLLGRTTASGEVQVMKRINGSQPFDVFAEVIGELLRSSK
jgi:predicted DsbA family dithiol-disulfide isomerase